MPPQIGRARGFSAPGSYTPLSQGGWNGYPQRSALPPLTVPEPPQHISHSSYHSSHHGAGNDDSTFAYNSNPYPPSYSEQGNSWNFSPVSSSSSSHNGSLSSLLNPSSHSNGYSSRPTPTINTSYSSPFSSMPMQEHSASSLSPDSHSRPTTGYSMTSVSSIGYPDDRMDYHSSSRPSSSHHNRSMTPPRPSSSSKSPYADSLSVRRTRRHSQALNPYPSPMYHDQRPSTSPQPASDHHGHHAHAQHASPAGGSILPRPRSMIQLPSVEQYSFSPQAEFAYSGPGPMEYRPSTGGGRPSTGTSATSSSHANTPPVTDGFGGGTDINRCRL